jgi:hypothetical protein
MSVSGLRSTSVTPDFAQCVEPGLSELDLRIERFGNIHMLVDFIPLALHL